MKPRFKSSHFRSVPPVRREARCRPSARDLMTDSGLGRGEFVLYGMLLAAVGFAFVQHAQAAHGFVAKLPEFATVVAELVRGLV